MKITNRLSWKYVRDEIHHEILSGRYGPGDRLPRDADIANQLNCARSTVQRAMQDLSDIGLVERRRKGGTRVHPEPVTRATLDIPITRHEVEKKRCSIWLSTDYARRNVCAAYCTCRV